MAILGATPVTANVALNYIRTRAPLATDDVAAGYAVGSYWTNQTTQKTYICTFAATGAAVWTEVGAAPPPPSNEPPAIAGQGYTQVFYDDFNSLNTITWRLGGDGQPEVPANFSVANSILSIFCRTSDNAATWMMSKRPYAYQYGYFECRMRYTRSTNAHVGPWLLSDGWVGNWPNAPTHDCSTFTPSAACELDIFESYHQFESPTTYQFCTGTLHPSTNSQCGWADTEAHGKNPWSNVWVDSGMVLADNYRTYAALWTATTVTWYIDDIQVRTYPAPSTFAQKMRLLVGSNAHTLHVNEIRTDVDWWRVWQKP